jgi:hypothetical protein
MIEAYKRFVFPSVIIVRAVAILKSKIYNLKFYAGS